jgi:hypothetical protein
MLIRSSFVVATSLVLSVAALGCATTPPPGAAGAACGGPAARSAEAPATPRAHHVYRLDFVVSSGDAGKGAYTIVVDEDHGGGELRVGANVSLSGPTQPMVRQDVGLLLRYNVMTIGDDLLLHGITELSAFDEPSRISKLTANGDAFVAPGKPALVASVEDPEHHHRYQVMVTATKLR